ncbi:bacteriocin immunity protein [Lactococcus nasutitermitis]|uniref:Bacteriocin immunity protein n=1 Tax=Lactococcus nasutitermitis TaxID=1652957 RepID=A0ABV9JFI2_9LACT|nr:bacteriocin immunity protein [Lactococcus nasutitermitis]
MNTEELEILNRIYNLILDRDVRDWERHFLLETKNRIEAGGRMKTELSNLEANLRPLAMRFNLTPKMADFYKSLTSSGLFGRGAGKILE